MPDFWDHTVNLVWSEKAPAGLVFGDWLTGYTVVLVKWSIYRDTKVLPWH